MLRTALITAALLAVPGTAPATQPAADFSGRWTLDTPAVATTPAVPGDMGSGWGSPISITQDARQLTVEYVFFSRYDIQPPLTFRFPLDGSEGRNIVAMGRGEQVESSRARWDGQALVITTTLPVADRSAATPFTATVTRTLRLESPTSLVVEVTRAGVLGGPSSTTRSIYKKELK